MLNGTEQNIPFYNDVINKRKLQSLIYQTFQNYGIIKSSIIVDRVKNLTFHYATRSGISLNAEDLRVPYGKRKLIKLTNSEVGYTEQKYNTGAITSVERFQKIIDIWNNASNSLKDEVLTYFRESDPLNPLYIMAFSGARGNISQVRQLIGMRGLMADPQGQIIDLPIKSNFREGLKVTEYVISSYGARKGLVDTALRTADSGYLTRRLVDVAQDIIVRDEDCLTMEGLSYNDLFQRYPTTLSFRDKLIGRLLAQPVLSNDKNIILATRNTAITIPLITKFENCKLESIKVRSPLTCNSHRSVCRKCYGWHLSYSRIVDLGEAVGIVAAQSIGEPGTQLTMRTFHTGGVFSGDLTRQIRTPFSGRVLYSLSSKTAMIRTMHGEKGFRLVENIDLFIENNVGTCIKFQIPQGSILLVNNNQWVYESQILAEVKKDTNLILEEDNKHIYTQISGETFFQNVEIDNIIDKQGSINQVSKKAGLIWVLNGERYSLPKPAIIERQIGLKISPKNVLARQQISNKFSGLVKFESSVSGKYLKVLNFSLMLKNTRISKRGKKDSILTILGPNTETSFYLKVKDKDFLTDGQTLAILKGDHYKTQTGGIICYDLEDNRTFKKKKSTRKMFSGSIYWIPEETHNLNSSILKNLKVKNNTIIKKGEEIWPGNYTKLGGLVQFDDLTQELTIKPCELFLVTKNLNKKKLEKKVFIKPGETLINDIIAQKLCYCEYIEFNNLFYLLVRPVEVYSVPRDKGFSLEHSFFPTNTNQNIKLKIVKRIFFKNWERIKSNTGVDLLQTFLTLDLKTKYVNLQPQIETVPISGTGNYYGLKVSLYEVFKTEHTNLKEIKENSFLSTNYLVKENQYIYPNTIVLETTVYCKLNGTFIKIKNNESTAKKDILILKEKDIKYVSWSSEKDNLKIQVGDLIRAGGNITNSKKSPYSGQIYKISENSIQIRVGRPYLISENSILRVNSGDFVQRSDMLATLVYDKLKTVDIVQGLPKVEEILEARKIKNSCLLVPADGQIYTHNYGAEIVTEDGNSISIPLTNKEKIKYVSGDFVNVASPLTDGQVSPHEMLDTLFQYYRGRVDIAQACKLSFKYLQLFLVNEVQRTYLAQGVQISDKHIEVIVKQMTSKVKVEESGNTILLPGEILSLYQAELITKTAYSNDDSPPFYTPILLGLTKAALNSDSFISAASFQETTRVLTEAAIEGKKDWLNGLKENVIIGRLIPAGTGFNCYEHFRKLRSADTNDNKMPKTNLSFIKEDILQFRLNET